MDQEFLGRQLLHYDQKDMLLVTVTSTTQTQGLEG